MRIDDNDDPVWLCSDSVYRWDVSEDSIVREFQPTDKAVDLRPCGGDFCVSDDNTGGGRKCRSDGSPGWTAATQDSNAVETTSDAVYAPNASTTSRYEHDGAAVWSNALEWSSNGADVEAGPKTWVYAQDKRGNADRLAKSDGGYEWIHSSSSRQYDLGVETGPDRYVFVTDTDPMEVLDSDGTYRRTRLSVGR
jgi:hypothetical protein